MARIKATEIKKVAKKSMKAKPKAKAKTGAPTAKKKFDRKKVAAAYKKEGSYEKAAAKLGCSAATVKYHVKKQREAEAPYPNNFTY